MKKLLYNNYQSDGAPIIAMATINPQLCKKYGIRVEIEQANEGPIPHMHVYLDPSRNPKNCAFIRLDKAEYSTHHKTPSLQLNRKQKEEFIEIMNSEWPKQAHFSPDGSVRVATGYEAAVDTWVDTWEDGDYSKFTLDEHGDPICPDYSVL